MSLHIPKGFKATAVKCGIKKNQNHDFVMIASDTPCSVAAMFTLNKVCAAPVLVCKELLSKCNNHGVQAVVINSGCANAVTGEEGLKNARTMASIAGKALGLKQDALVMSTGVIGVQLDMTKIEKGVAESSKSLQESEEAWQLAAKGIMTTDMFPKITSAKFGKTPISITGIAKGAGMIHPNMATMLSVLATDAKISPACLDKALRYAVDRSFNSVTVDGDTSTNDTVAILANGQAGNAEISDPNSPEFKEFQDNLLRTSIFLAKEIVRDGEGATKVVTVHIKGAPSVQAAKTVANSITKSSLVKTAIFGQDANWGRVLAAVGYSGVDVVPEKISLWFAKGEGEQLAKGETSPTEVLPLLKNGTPLKFDETQALALLKNKEIAIIVDLGLGEHSTTMWTCDLTFDYIKINASYRS
jgi:glutamate N-acetyltransferase/amino-acid N-acetyltransferase